MGTFANAVNASLNARLPYDAHKDLQPSRWCALLQHRRGQSRFADQIPVDLDRR